MNIWLLLSLVIPVILVFSTKPEDYFWKRFGRLFLSIGSFYVLLNLCLYILGQESKEMGLLIGIVFGWFPAFAYVGLLELLWRIKNHKAIKQLGNKYHGKWLGNFSIFFFVIAWLHLLVGIIFHIGI